MNKDLKFLLKRAFDAGTMYEATLSEECSFNEFIKYVESQKLSICDVMCSLNLAEIENLVILKHYDDSDFGWSKKDCEEMREESRKAVGYTKTDLENYT